MNDNQETVTSADAPVSQEAAAPEAFVAEDSAAGAEADTQDASGEDGEAGSAGEPDEPEQQGEDGEGEGRRRRPPRSQRLKREVERLRAEVATLRSQPVQADGTDWDAAIRAEIGDPPRAQDFGDPLAFERAATAYTAARVVVGREISRSLQAQAAEAAVRRAAVLDDFSERQDDVRKAIPDFDAVVAQADGVPLSDVVENLIIESEKGPLLQYHLAQNPKMLVALNGLPPLAAAREIGRLEGRLSLPKPNTATKARPPVAPVKGGAGAMTPSQEVEAYIARTYGRR